MGKILSNDFATRAIQISLVCVRVCVCVCFFPAKQTSVTELSHANKKICSADRKNVCKPRLHNDWRQPRAWAMDAFLTRGPHFPG